MLQIGEDACRSGKQGKFATEASSSVLLAFSESGFLSAAQQPALHLILNRSQSLVQVFFKSHGQFAFCSRRVGHVVLTNIKPSSFRQRAIS